MVVAKLFLLLVVAVAQQAATIAPNPRPPTERLREQHGTESMASYITAISGTVIWSWVSLECSILLAVSGYCPPALARRLLHFFLPTATTITLDPSTFTTPTPALLGGTLLSLAGAFLRTHCFRKLGPRFTFELSIQPSHALVTDGVYGIVRHPGYTGGIAVVGGVWLCMFDRRGALVSVCVAWVQTYFGGSGNEDGDAMLTGMLMCIWATIPSITFAMIYQRMNREDAMLEKNFGEEWRGWAKRVPYRLIPGVY